MCKHTRWIYVDAKCSDMSYIKTFDGQEHDGYVPAGIGIGSGDYISFTYCADCGKIIDYEFPLKELNIKS